MVPLAVVDGPGGGDRVDAAGGELAAQLAVGAHVQHGHAGGGRRAQRLVLVAEQRAAGAGDRGAEPQLDRGVGALLHRPLGNVHLGRFAVEGGGGVGGAGQRTGRAQADPGVAAGVLAQVDRDLAGRGRAVGLTQPPVGLRPGVQHGAAVVRARAVVVAGARGGARPAHLGEQVTGVAVGPGQRDTLDLVRAHAADVVAGPGEGQRPAGGVGLAVGHLRLGQPAVRAAVAEHHRPGRAVGDPGEPAVEGELERGAGGVQQLPRAGVRGQRRGAAPRRGVAAVRVAAEPHGLTVRIGHHHVAGAVVVRHQLHVVAAGPAGAEQPVAPRVQAVVGAHQVEFRADRGHRRVQRRRGDVADLRVELLVLGGVRGAGQVRGDLRLRHAGQHRGVRRDHLVGGVLDVGTPLVGLAPHQGAGRHRPRGLGLVAGVDAVHRLVRGVGLADLELELHADAGRRVDVQRPRPQLRRQRRRLVPVGREQFLHHRRDVEDLQHDPAGRHLVVGEHRSAGLDHGEVEEVLARRHGLDGGVQRHPAAARDRAGEVGGALLRHGRARVRLVDPVGQVVVARLPLGGALVGDGDLDLAVLVLQHHRVGHRVGDGVAGVVRAVRDVQARRVGGFRAGEPLPGRGVGGRAQRDAVVGLLAVDPPLHQVPAAAAQVDQLARGRAGRGRFAERDVAVVERLAAQLTAHRRARVGVAGAGRPRLGHRVHGDLARRARVGVVVHRPQLRAEDGVVLELVHQAGELDVGGVAGAHPQGLPAHHRGAALHRVHAGVGRLARHRHPHGRVHQHRVDPGRVAQPRRVHVHPQRLLPTGGHQLVADAGGGGRAGVAGARVHHLARREHRARCAGRVGQHHLAVHQAGGESGEPQREHERGGRVRRGQHQGFLDPARLCLQLEVHMRQHARVGDGTALGGGGGGGRLGQPEGQRVRIVHAHRGQAVGGGRRCEVQADRVGGVAPAAALFGRPQRGVDRLPGAVGVLVVHRRGGEHRGLRAVGVVVDALERAALGRHLGAGGLVEAAHLTGRRVHNGRGVVRVLLPPDRGVAAAHAGRQRAVAGFALRGLVAAAAGRAPLLLRGGAEHGLPLGLGGALAGVLVGQPTGSVTAAGHQHGDGGADRDHLDGT